MIDHLAGWAYYREAPGRWLQDCVQIQVGRLAFDTEVNFAFSACSEFSHGIFAVRNFFGVGCLPMNFGPWLGSDAHRGNAIESAFIFAFGFCYGNCFDEVDKFQMSFFVLQGRWCFLVAGNKDESDRVKNYLLDRCEWVAGKRLRCKRHMSSLNF